MVPVEVLTSSYSPLLTYHFALCNQMVFQNQVLARWGDTGAWDTPPEDTFSQEFFPLIF